MNFYAVFNTVIVINDEKMEKWLQIKQNNVLQIFWISNILCIFLLHSMDFQNFLWKHYDIILTRFPLRPVGPVGPGGPGGP